MEAVKIAEDIYWVGAIDWNGRNFHGYETPRGTSYNSFLILDEHPTLIDAVKAPFFSQLAQRIRSVIDPRKIEYIISNHSEPDHASGLRMAQTLTGGAKVFCSKMGKEDLRMNFGEMEVTVVEDGSEMKIGKHTLKFVYTQMVHWPDSMMTYVPEEGILFSMDAFGQHFASSKRFDDEVDEAVLFEEAEIYYANIILPYGPQVMKAFERLKEFDLKMLATAHGVLWRKNIAQIMEKYVGYATYTTEPRAVVVYDTMWGSTQIMAEAISERGIISEGVPVKVYRVTDTPRSTIMREVMMSRAMVLGSADPEQRHLPDGGGHWHLHQGAKAQRPLCRGFQLLRMGFGHDEADAGPSQWQRHGTAVRGPSVPVRAGRGGQGQVPGIREADRPEDPWWESEGQPQPTPEQKITLVKTA